ncbi:VWA domain-containing protein [Streptomyces scopuliridis]|uniref:VWA domain-containing protein n=1 Tax=Streptomyces scopuliridis TaxID=452529 RepID=UPI002DD7ADD5|nr:VWA domain-containing protein [Streptomyces scopuliridis]
MLPFALLLLVMSGLPSSAAEPRAAVPVPEPPVTPAVVTERLDPGASLSVDKLVRTPAIPPKPDIVLLVDGTLSMEPSIEQIQRNLPVITERVTEEQPDSRFAVATYGDQQVDGDRTYTVLQPFTDDLVKVQEGVDALTVERGQGSRGPSEDWINALWQIANGSGGQTEFRADASPVVVLVGDASSHDPSRGHSLTDTIYALQDRGVRVLGVDVATAVGDGLNGTGDAGVPGQIEDPLHPPGQADKVIEATRGSLISGVNADAVVKSIADGLGNLPTQVGHRLESCDPALTVALAPPTRTVTSGDPAAFDETITVAEDAPQGRRLTCTVQFLLGTSPPGTDTVGPNAAADPELTQTINIDVNDVDAPVVVVDDRTVVTRDPDGARVELTVTAVDANDGRLPVRCTPASGSVFPVGRTLVTCSATDSNGNTGTDMATVEVLELPPVPPVPPAPPVPPTADVAVDVQITPSRTYTGRAARARFVLTNAGPDAATGVIVTSAWPRTPDAGRRTLAGLSRCTPTAPCTIPAGGRVEVTQTATYRMAISGAVHATAVATLPDRRPANNTDRGTLRVLQPKLAVTPQVATPGQVVLARGTDFPPGSTVRLSWSAGITANGSPVTVGRDGTFETQVPVLRRDRLGPRDLRADVTGLDRLTKPVLVVQRKLQPPDFAGRG